MGKKSTPLKIVFFSVLLVGFIVIQYSWVQSLQNNKLQAFRSRIISALQVAGEKIPYRVSRNELTDAVIAK